MLQRVAGEAVLTVRRNSRDLTSVLQGVCCSVWQSVAECSECVAQRVSDCVAERVAGEVVLKVRRHGEL